VAQSGRAPGAFPGARLLADVTGRRLTGEQPTLPLTPS
jgi:hypothetical protein